MWFQQSGDEEPRQRWHHDSWIDPAEVQPRIDAAIAAGGRLVSDERAPAYWVLADPEGNKICLCTWQTRDNDWQLSAPNPALPHEMLWCRRSLPMGPV